MRMLYLAMIVATRGLQGFRLMRIMRGCSATARIHLMGYSPMELTIVPLIMRLEIACMLESGLLDLGRKIDRWNSNLFISSPGYRGVVQPDLCILSL